MRFILHPSAFILSERLTFYLNDALDGPLPIALYSAALFSVTEGRAYSAAEYRAWLAAAGLAPRPLVPTLIHCGVLPALK